MFQELFAGHIFASFALTGQLTLDDHLRGNPRMVSPWLPENRLARHTVITHQNILNGVIDRMAHMQAARHIGRRNDDRKIIILGISRLGRTRLKRAALFPHLIEAGFGFLRIKLIVEHNRYLIEKAPQIRG